jgi:hypothetical protein
VVEVRSPLRAPRVPAIPAVPAKDALDFVNRMAPVSVDDIQHLSKPHRSAEPSAIMRIMRAEASLHSAESAGLAAIAEAYASTDANGKILLVEIAKRFGGA